MAWKINYSPLAIRQLRKLDKTMTRRIDVAMQEIRGLPDPRLRGKALTSNFAGLWRYRVGDYRVVCEINDGEMTVLALRIGHRSKIYRDHPGAVQK